MAIYFNVESHHNGTGLFFFSQRLSISKSENEESGKKLLKKSLTKQTFQKSQWAFFEAEYESETLKKKLNIAQERNI